LEQRRFDLENSVNINQKRIKEVSVNEIKTYLFKTKWSAIFENFIRLIFLMQFMIANLNQSFQLFTKGDSTANPTGNICQIRYLLIDGADSKKFVTSMLLEYPKKLRIALINFYHKKLWCWIWLQLLNHIDFFQNFFGKLDLNTFNIFFELVQIRCTNNVTCNKWLLVDKCQGQLCWC